MAKEITIIIDKSDLGPADDEFDITDDDLKLFDTKENVSLVNVFVDGHLVDPTTISEKSITVKRPFTSGSESSTIVVTTKSEKILNVLKYNENKKIEIKKPTDDEATLKGIAEAIKRIADLMPLPSASAAATSPGAASSSGTATPPGAVTPPIKDR
jgi:hypothetical protein